MKEINKEELKEILENHKKWTNGVEGGSRANLEGANLYGANLNCANLEGANLNRANLNCANLEGANLNCASLNRANGNMKEIKSIKIETYAIAYTDIVMQIGCENHKIKDWFEFSDVQIIEMDGEKALKFWRKWKPILQQIINDGA